MRRIGSLLTLAAILSAAGLAAQGGPALPVVEPFKLGTFEIDGRETVGIVLGDQLIVELAAANRDLQRRPDVARVPAPRDMLELIERYEYGMQRRIYEIVQALAAPGRLNPGRRPRYVHDVSSVRALAPILYPSKILNAAANYYGHVAESSTPEEQRKAAEARRRERGAPYLFLKPTRGAIVGNGDPIVIPRGRDRIDWECELAIVIGRPAKYVSASEAADYIFGYTIELDMSDRGGRPGGGQNFGSDWFVGKGHDTFAPMGPYIVPKEFMKDPMNLAQRLMVNGAVMQDSRSSDMIHNIYELVEYGSSIMTLFPGDVVAAGSPAGTGMSRSVRPEQVFLKPGDKIVASIDGIGTLTHTAVAESGPATSSAAR